jgi:hypothetical protein
VRDASIRDCRVWTTDVQLDATVPNWRFHRHGDAALRAEYERWFAHPGSFDAVRRIPVADGEVVEYDLVWEEDFVPHSAHHVHILRLRDDLIASDTVMCGGRWPASLLAEMEAADRA